MSSMIKAVKSEIHFGVKNVDIYKLENYRFEKRFGVTGVGLSLGYSKSWFNRLPKNGVDQYEALLRNGFTGCQIQVKIPREHGRGASVAKTISIRDFNKVVAYEALIKKNIDAIIILIALSESGLERLVDDAFNGVSLDWFAEKIIHYSQWTYEELEQVLAENREDVKTLYLSGERKNLHLNY